MSRASGSKRAKQRARLFEEQGGRCFYCRQPMVLTWDFKPHAAPPDNLATFEHRHSRLNPERGRHAGEQINVVACNRCNWLRGEADKERLMQTFPEEIWRRARAWPAGFQPI